MSTSSLQVLVEFGRAAAKKPQMLVLTLYGSQEERCELMVPLAWRQGQALVNLKHCHFQPGLWTLQGNICLISPHLTSSQLTSPHLTSAYFTTELETRGGSNLYHKDKRYHHKENVATSLILERNGGGGGGML